MNIVFTSFILKRYAPCLSLVLQFNICDEKQKEFSQRTFKKFYQVIIF